MGIALLLKQIVRCMLLVPFWFVFLIAMVLGWVWKPKWARFLRGKKLKCVVTSSNSYKDLSSLIPDSPSMPSSPIKSFSSAPCLITFKEHAFKRRSPSCIVDWMIEDVVKNNTPTSEASHDEDTYFSKPQAKVDEDPAVTEQDLEYLSQQVQKRDDDPSWIPMISRCTLFMSHQSWRRDSEYGPPQFCIRTVYEDATPEELRDFFWDDEFRSKWDDMLVYATTLEACPVTGTMVVHWIRKFPLFCGDREYTVARRIWASGRTYYCVTKGVSCSSVPRRDRPRRVDNYYSSWYIQAVESSKESALPTACEVTFFHHEDIGIPREIAKLAVRQGMWGAVMKTERGLRAYQKQRKSGAPLSRFAILAQVTTPIRSDQLRSYGCYDDLPEAEKQQPPLKNISVGNRIPKLLLIGGVVILACTLDKGILIKSIMIGVGRLQIGRKFDRIRKKVIR